MKLNFIVNKSISIVFDYLTDMEKFTFIHPIISKMVEQDHGGYKVYETLKVGFIPLPFTYFVKITEDRANNLVFMNAVVFKLTKIELRFSLSEDGVHTKVQEDITFRTLLPIKFLLRRIFREQHVLLFENLNNCK